MKKIIKGPFEGKTTELIKMSSDNGYYIVCYGIKEAFKIAQMADEMKLRIPFPLTYQEFINNRYYGHGINGFLIDNADNFLQSLTSVEIKAITLSK